MLRQDRIEQLIAEWPRIEPAPHLDIDKLFDELLTLNPSSHDLERALIGSVMTVHMLSTILRRLADIERWISYLDKEVRKCSA